MTWHYLYLAWLDARRSPWLVAIVVVTLAVGLASSMSTLALRHALTGDPIPGKSHRLLTLQGPPEARQRHGLFSYAQASGLRHSGARHGQSVISGEAVIRALSVAGEPRHFGGGVGIRYTTRNFFRVFDAPLKAGRTWTKREQADAAPVMVLGAGLADELFPEAGAVGKQVRAGSALYTVIGVLKPWHPEPRYYDMDSPSGVFGSGGDAIYLPYTAVRHAPAHALISMVCRGSGTAPSIPQPDRMVSSPCRWLSMWYLAADRNDVPALKRHVRASLSRVLPPAQQKDLQLLDVQQLLTRADLVPASLQTYLLLGIAFLLLCVVNASGMQLSRALRRTSSIGVRRALGARRADIVRQHLCESLLVGVVGGALGIAMTYGVLALVRHIPQRYVMYSYLAQVDGWTLAVMAGVALTGSVLAGLVPALVASRADPALAIKDVE